MKFNVSSKTLYNYVASVSKIINAKNTMQILYNFLFVLEGDVLTIKAADLENSLVGRLQVSDAEGAGRFCLDARRIVELFKEMPDQGITFEIDDENFEIKISYSNGCYNTVAINGLEYPDKAINTSSEDTVSFLCSGQQVMKGIENTLFAVGNDEIRPQMMGILWDVKPECVVFVATDTRKLVRYTNGTSQPGVNCSFILPVKGASVLKNVFAKEEEIKVTVSNTSAVFETENFTFECRLIKGNYPDYNRVIPANNPFAVTVDRQSFLTSIRRVAVFGDEGGGLVKFHFAPNEVKLSASDNSFGTSGWESVPCDYDGNEMNMGFSSMYLIEILGTISTKEVTIKIADRSRPALFLPAENESECELVMILMPMNIAD
ncbi:MAG: DNA polymerase III subunit beta [Bacteroides sp.]|nr:DNA polymerase III subunit beta [Bacteroides sp.]MCM1413352.1 DNA polymerase III subunit beta [Bacteroides sp.]MCM1471962.1 DNA polymerase III subunit beta [Bacteroides sp.]